VSRLPIRASAQELSKEASDKAAAEAREKRNAQTFELNASTIVFYDRTGKRIGARSANARCTKGPSSLRMVRASRS
jgi:hypothetical protein